MTRDHEEPNDSVLVDDLEKLNDEFRDLSRQEDELFTLLQRLHDEEAMLQQALLEATAATGEQRVEQHRRRKDESAIARLEQALLESATSSSEGDDDTAQDVQSLISFPKRQEETLDDERQSSQS